MAIKRSNILKDAVARKKYTDGVIALKNEFTGVTTRDFGIAGPTNQVSTYDLFVVWHQIAMMTLTPPTQRNRNAAHSGPVFLPWHRYMLREYELSLQRVLGDTNFGLPYWDWAADGELTPAQQRASKIWAADCMGGSGDPVTTGPFAFNAADPKSFRVRIVSDSGARLGQTNRGLSREIGEDQDNDSLPRKANVKSTLANKTYDTAPWNGSSLGSFRNALEGWRPYGMHNLVHVWVGGDMLPATSPNDPVFFMNHCNVDRIWEAWLQENGLVYIPDDSASPDLKGHRLHDELSSLIAAPTTPAAMLDISSVYEYDTLKT